MHVLHTATLGAILSLALASDASAEQKSLKEAIVGPRGHHLNGEKRDNWGGPVSGQLTFGRTGRFSTIIIGPSGASMKTDDPRKPDALIVAYYGSYTVDEAGKKINGKIEGASYSARFNMDTTWTVHPTTPLPRLVGRKGWPTGLGCVNAFSAIGGVPKLPTWATRKSAASVAQKKEANAAAVTRHTML
jgi:hypothetical protein